MKKFLFLLLSVFVFSLAVGQADAGKGGEKLSATLRAQIAEKNEYVENQTSSKFKALKDMGLQESDSQVVFLHFKKKPRVGQLKSLTNLGVKVFDDSWIPPIGKHPTGYMITKIPLDKIRRVARKTFVTRLETAESLLAPQNDEAAKSIEADKVWQNFGWTGDGVKIAVLDSGLDTTHGDIPSPIASKDYSNYPNLDDTIENKVTGHGTHVTGSVLGRGTQSNGKYKGIAHGADLIFLKIGDDFSSGATPSAMIGAIKAAADLYNADIITMSYGGFDSYHDGSDEICQAVDYANSKGVIVFVAAGNEGAKQEHYSDTVKAGKKTNYIEMDVAGFISLNLDWFDGLGSSNDLEIKLYDRNKKEISASVFRDSESPRGTELEVLSVFVSEGTYYVKVANNSNNDQFFHIYSLTPLVTFQNADPNYTVLSPALADGAVAVASYNTRTSWTNYLGDFYDFEWFGGKTGEISSFSSRGPRIDGAEKPQLAAPGAWLISARDKILALGGADYLIIDNDGINDGKGPADYAASVGTSMACPIAAGGAALLMQADPKLKGKPEDVKNLLFSTASNNGSWFPDSGWGKINILNAISSIPPPPPPTPTPTKTSTPTPIPSPTTEPSPIVPPTPLPSPTFTPSPAPTPTTTATVTPTPIPTVEPTPVIPPSPIPTPTRTCTPEPPPIPSPVPTVEDGGGGEEPPPKDTFEVQSTNPKDGATDVKTDVMIIKVKYNQSINGDPLALDRNGSGVEFRVEGTEVNLPVTLDIQGAIQGKDLIIKPSEPLEPGTTYTLKIFWWALKAANNAGTQMANDFKMKFTTGGE